MKKIDIFKRLLILMDKGYSWEAIKYSDDLYETSDEEKDLWSDCYNEIQTNGFKWAYEFIENN